MKHQLFFQRMDWDDYALLGIKNLHRINKAEKYDHIFIDEILDMQPMQLNVLIFLNKGTLTLSGNEWQRIFKNSPFFTKNWALISRVKASS